MDVCVRILITLPVRNRVVTVPSSPAPFLPTFPLVVDYYVGNPRNKSATRPS